VERIGRTVWPGEGATARCAATRRVPIDTLVISDSPRIGGEDSEHIRLLAECDVALPPILVHRSTMRVVDGMHRLRAATLCGEKEIEVQFQDGSDFDMFLSAVEANTTHGLRLTWADRVAATTRILHARSDWSDRRVAAIVGLSGRTVGRCRQQLSQATATMSPVGDSDQLESFARQRLAAEIIKERPQASVRDVARAAGLSRSTVLTVMSRMSAAGESAPLPDHAVAQLGLDDAASEPPEEVDADAQLDLSSTLRSLHSDPSVRYSDSGRALLRWLNARMMARLEWQEFVDMVPAHWAETVAELARDTAEAWMRFADLAERPRASSANAMSLRAR
jgi:ParB-like chromosome segregation protein Spo0J